MTTPPHLPSPPGEDSPSFLAFVRSIRHQVKHVQMALLTSFVQAFLLISLEAAVLAIFSRETKILKDYKLFLRPDPNTSVDVTFAEQTLTRAGALSLYYVMFMLAQIFQVLLCVDAIWNKNTIQVIGLAGFNFILLAYSIVQIVQAQMLLPDYTVKQLTIQYPAFQHLAARPLTFVIAALMLVFALYSAMQAWTLYREFGWIIYKKIGADLRMRKMFMVYQIFIMILKLDIFMLLSFSLQYLSMLINEANNSIDHVKDHSQVIIHSVVSCGGSLVLLLVAFGAIRTENKWGMRFFFVVDLATVGYFVSKLVLMQKPFSTPGTPCTYHVSKADCDRYDGNRNFFTLFLSVDILLGLITLFVAIKAYMNFGKGLKAHLSGKSADGTLKPELQYGLTHSDTKRWTID